MPFLPICTNKYNTLSVEEIDDDTVNQDVPKQKPRLRPYLRRYKQRLPRSYRIAGVEGCASLKL